MATFGIPTDWETLLPLIAARAATAGSWINSSYSFTSLDLGDIEEAGGPADSFVALMNPSITPVQSWVAGGGNGSMLVDGTVEVHLWDRCEVDEGYRSTARLESTTLGILRKWKQLLKALQLWYPETAGASKLSEPMRLINAQVMPVKNGWAKVVSRWSVKFIQDLS